MSLQVHPRHRHSLRLVGGIAAKPDRDFFAFRSRAPNTDGDFAVRSRETGHVYADRFPTKAKAEEWIDERFYGMTPVKPKMTAMAVRCRVGVAPYVFAQVYTAVSYDPSGFFDKLCVYVPNMWGTFRALPADASIFDPVNPAHAARFKHHAVAGFTPLSAALAQIVDKFGAGAITTGADMAGRAA